LANTYSRLGLAVALVLSCLAPEASAQVGAQDTDLQLFAVHVNRTPKQDWPGYGIYLGNGLVLTAAHVTANVLETKPRVAIGAKELPASLIKQGSFEGVDLTLLSIDAKELPIRLQMRRLPLCERGPYAGEMVVVVIPEGTARSRVLSPLAIPADLRDRFGSVIGDVATTGNSGSGVFDVLNQCLLGIISRKLSVGQIVGPFEKPARVRDVAKYFVPVRDIRAFIPGNVTF